VAPYFFEATYNYAIEARIQAIKLLTPNKDAYFGIALRVSTDVFGDVAGVGRFPFGGTIYAGAFIFTFLQDPHGPNATYSLDTEPHLYRVEAKEKTVKLFIDTVPQWEQADDTYLNAGEKVGLINLGYQLKVSSFTVFSL